jgi:hypothetical protein
LALNSVFRQKMVVYRSQITVYRSQKTNYQRFLVFMNFSNFLNCGFGKPTNLTPVFSGFVNHAQASRDCRPSFCTVEVCKLYIQFLLQAHICAKVVNHAKVVPVGDIGKKYTFITFTLLHSPICARNIPTCSIVDLLSPRGVTSRARGWVPIDSGGTPTAARSRAGADGLEKGRING